MRGDLRVVEGVAAGVAERRTLLELYPGRGEREALLAAGRRMDAELARLGVTEDELLADFRRRRKTRRGK